jgi:hypothetical protein
MLYRIHCDKYCPAHDKKERGKMQSLLANKEVWMCHDEPIYPCVGTKLNHVPEGYEKIQTQLIWEDED